MAPVPVPMLARLADDLPDGPWSYEPKLDGFRCIACARGGAVELHSRHGRPLARYFPELVEELRRTADDAVLDGEIVVPRAGGFDFPALMSRLHPSASRVERLRRESPAAFAAFDLLRSGGEELAAQPFAERRARLEALLGGARGHVLLTPRTLDARLARAWLASAPGSGIEGVVAKRDDLPYQPGRRAMVKVKALRTADCVVAGFREFPGAGAVASLLLGVHDRGVLRHVGVASSFTDAQRVALWRALRDRVAPLEGHPWQRGFHLEHSPLGRLAGSAGRWDPRTMVLDWTPLRPDLVCEVCYDRLDGLRFRHPARFLRWRPDREAASCTADQLAVASPASPPARPG